MHGFSAGLKASKGWFLVAFKWFKSLQKASLGRYWSLRTCRELQNGILSGIFCLCSAALMDPQTNIRKHFCSGGVEFPGNHNKTAASKTIKNTHQLSNHRLAPVLSTQTKNESRSQRLKPSQATVEP